MSNEIGKLIGTVSHALSITNHDGDKVSITVKFDYSTATDAEIRSWLNGSRAIAFQRPTRDLSVEEIEALDGSTIMANAAGVKIKGRSEKIEELTRVFVSSGVPIEQAKALATAAVDNPSSLRINS